MAHAGVNRVILSEALGLPPDYLFRLDQNYGCLNVIDYFPDMAVVRLINGGVNGVTTGSRRVSAASSPAFNPPRKIWLNCG